MNKKEKKYIKNKKNEKLKKTKNNLSYKNINDKANLFILTEKKLWTNLKNKYNCNKHIYESFLVEYLLNNVNCHLVSVFKEKMIDDYIDEFLHRRYTNFECEDRIPKFYKYYKNYLLFFCKPIFKDQKYNKLIQYNGEKKAELYYKKNYLKSKSIDNIKDFGFEKTDSEISSEGQKNSQIKKDEIIFNDSVKKNLENITIMTTISNDVNKTVNLNIDNERLEVFCENKYDKSNDTTVVNFIDNYQKELQNNKNKKNHKNFKNFNHSYILGKNNFSGNKNNKVFKSSSTYKHLINNFSNKILKEKLINKSNKRRKNENKEEKNNRNISIEKLKNSLKLYCSNTQKNKLRSSTNSKIKKGKKYKTNMSLKMIHKGYYKLENELNNIVINYRNNLKDKYNQIYTTNISSTPYNDNKINKSRNINNKLLHKQSSILTVNNNSIFGIHNNKTNNLYIYNSNNKSYNFNGLTINAKINKNNNKDLKSNSKNNKNQKKNLYIKTENTNKIINYKNNNCNNHKDSYKKYNNHSTKNYHTQKLIRIHKNEKLFKNKNKNKNEKNIITVTEIKNKKINNSKENTLNLKIKKNNQSRNYASCSCLNIFDEGYSTKYFIKKKNINHYSVTNLNNHQIYNNNKINLIKRKKNLNKKTNNKKRSMTNISSNLIHISLPLNYNNKLINNKSSHKYLTSINISNNNIFKYKEYKNINSNSISNIYNADSKFKKNKNKPRSNSKNKTELNNNTSYKNNKYSKIISSYITKNVSNPFNKNINKYKNIVK